MQNNIIIKGKAKFTVMNFRFAFLILPGRLIGKDEYIHPVSEEFSSSIFVAEMSSLMHMKNVNEIEGVITRRPFCALPASGREAVLVKTDIRHTITGRNINGTNLSLSDLELLNWFRVK
jgi:hypothetical protein